MRSSSLDGCERDVADCNRTHVVAWDAHKLRACPRNGSRRKTIVGDCQRMTLRRVSRAEETELMSGALDGSEQPGAVCRCGCLSVAADNYAGAGHRTVGASADNAASSRRYRHRLNHRERDKTAAARQEERREQTRKVSNKGLHCRERRSIAEQELDRSGFTGEYIFEFMDGFPFGLAVKGLWRRKGRCHVPSRAIR